jgi:hypothetical protein
MKSKYWRAVNKRVNHLVKRKGWGRREALLNTRTLFKKGSQWRRHYENL